MKKLSTILLIILALSSCSSEKINEIKITEPPKELILNVEQSIDGDLGQYVSALNERIKITFAKEEDPLMPGFDYEFKVKMNFHSSLDVKTGTGYNHYGPSMEVEFLDKDGKVLEQCNASMSSSYQDLADNLKSGSREEWISFTGHYMVNSMAKASSLDDSKKFLEKLTSATMIRVKSEIIEEEQDPDAGSSASSDGSSGGGGDCEAFLDDYEEVVMEYVKIAKKMQSNPNNPSYSMDLAKVASKISEMDGDFNDCSSDAVVMNKLMALQAKMANAMM